MATPQSRIRAEAERLLRLQGDAPGWPVNVKKLAQGLGIQVVEQHLQGDGDVDISGFYYRSGEESVIGVNAAHPAVRRRFTIAHELGHAILEQRDGMHIDEAFRLRDKRSASATDPDEIAANAFAAELLMPPDEVRLRLGDGVDYTDDSSVRDLARHFGVSQQAMMFRLINLGVSLDGKARFG